MSKKIFKFFIISIIISLVNINVAFAYPYYNPYYVPNPRCYEIPYPPCPYVPYCGGYYYDSHDYRDSAIITGAFNLITTLIVINTLTKTINNTQQNNSHSNYSNDRPIYD